MIPLLGPLLAKPAIAGVVGFLRSVPRKVWYALILALVAWWVYDKIHDRGAASRDQEVAALERQVEELTEANEQAQLVIEKLVAANTELAAGRVADQEAAKEKVAELEKQRAELARKLSRSQREREKLYERDAQARAWADAGMPVSVADSLWGPGSGPPADR